MSKNRQSYYLVTSKVPIVCVERESAKEAKRRTKEQQQSLIEHRRHSYEGYKEELALTRAEYKELESEENGTSTVYAAKYGNRIKIGVTTNMYWLLSNYRRLVPDIEIIWSVPGDKALEKAMHRALQGFNISHKSGKPSEVFEVSDDTDFCVKILELAYVSVSHE